MTEDKPTLIPPDSLRGFCEEVFFRLGVTRPDAAITADVLVAADLRGVDSHGVARLKRYVDGLRDGVMKPRPETRVVAETPVTITYDADAGLGQPVSAAAMRKAMEKAARFGAGFASVRNSNHYGIAGYYAMMALEQGMIGISTTNSDVLVVPTFSRNAVLGTNPIAVAVPAGKCPAFVLDMATSTVPRGKLEVYSRLEKPMPQGWATDEHGVSTADSTQVLKNMATRAGGGLLPLGGEGELLSGHKGYGLALLVDILSAVLSGAAYADLVYPRGTDGKPLPANLGHFFGAFRVDAFRPLDEFQRDMDDLFSRLKNADKAAGAERIYVHGEKEFEKAAERQAKGIPLHPKVASVLAQIGDEVGVRLPL